ncbi:MAG: hypothetical protein F6K14_32040 [Symploca sp. SIO2C1]|nr:hypothetical protein [Symploca sp. SIO2C1]
MSQEFIRDFSVKVQGCCIDGLKSCLHGYFAPLIVFKKEDEAEARSVTA